MNKISFSKMHGLGNDFIIVNASFGARHFNAETIQRLSNRYTGVGFDQILLIEPSLQADFYCHIFNSDGSPARQCGNGLRCVARFVHENGLIKRKDLTLETVAGIFPVQIHDYEHIEITLNIPFVREKLIPLQFANQNILQAAIIDVGNPHAIFKIDDLSQVDVSKDGATIAAHLNFKEGVNVGFMQIVSNTHVRLRTFERGAGVTLACGSNACAAVVAGIVNAWLEPNVDVEFQEGKLHISWEKQDGPIKMVGPATHVYDGVLALTTHRSS